jgi:hypothetical protein
MSDDAMTDRPVKRAKRAGRALAVGLLRLPAIIAKTMPLSASPAITSTRRLRDSVLEASRSRNTHESADRSHRRLAGAGTTRRFPKRTSVRRASSAALLAALLALAACGSESPEDAVRETATQYSTALANGDADTACELTSSDAKRQLAAAGAGIAGGDCPAVMKMVLRALSDSDRRKLRDFSVTKVAIKGDRATAEDDNGAVIEARMGLVKNGDRWLIAADPSQLTGPGVEGNDTAGP